MGGLFKSHSVDSGAPVISSIQLQTSAFGRPITWVFGRQRVAPNLIQYDDFVSIPHTSKQRTGKGGGGGATTTDYTYQVASIMALGTGVLDSIGRVWKDKDTTTLAELKLDFYNGSANQDPHPYFATKHPDRALGYRGIAYVASGAYDLGSSASFGNHTFEVQAPGSIDSKYGTKVPDAEVADVVSALLTDPEQGVGLDPSALGDMDAFRQFCLASSLWVSPAYTEQRGAFEYIKRLLTIGFADCVYSGGKLKIVPYSDVPVSGPMGSYNPAIAPVCDLGEDDFIAGDGDDAVRISQKSSEETYNHVRVKFSDRANDYNDNIAESKDDADIEQYGLRSMDVVDMKEIADAAVAQKVSDFILHRSLYILNTYKFRLPWKHVRLEPMDVITLTYARKYLDQTPVLITEIEEDEDGMLSVSAEDYPMGANRHAMQPAPDIGNTVPNHAVAPGSINVPVLFEPPGKLTANDSQVWMGVSGGANWGGCVVWASTDDQTYQRIGTIRGPARQGVLQASLPAGPEVDQLNKLSVDLSPSRGELQGATEANARDLLTACYVGGEYLAYAYETLTGANRYSLAYLVRGAFGSAPAAHAAGAPFVFLDNAVFRYSFPRGWVGRTLWFKFTSFNQFGGQMQELATVQTYSHQLEGAKIGDPSYLSTAEQVFGINVTWGLPSDSAEVLQATQLWWSTTPDLSSASLLGEFAPPQNTYTVSGLPANVARYFWIRLVDAGGSLGNFYPAGAGIEGHSTKDAKAILDWLAGQITKTQLSQDLIKSIDLINTLDDIRDSIASSHLTGIIAANNAIIAEAAKRAEDLLKEADARATALLNEAKTRGAAITSVQTSVQTATTSLGSRIDTVTAATAAAAAAVQNEVTTRANETSALGQSISTVAATTNANTAAIVSEQIARTDAVSALAQTVTVVSAKTDSNAAAIVTEQTARTNAISAQAQTLTSVSAKTDANAAAIITEQTARTTANTAMAQSITSVSAKTDANAAAIVTEQTARTNADSALATSVTALTAQTSANLAAIVSEQNARTDAVSALSTKVDTVQATANNASAAVQIASSALATTNGKLSALHTIKTQVTAGGRTYIAGIGLGVEVNGGSVESQVLISAQRVALINEDSGGLTTPFVVQNGQVFINEAFIGSATIGNAQIKNAAVDTLTIAGNAVTSMVSASGGGSASINFSAYGAPVYLTAAGTGGWSAGGSPVSGKVTVTIFRDGSPINAVETRGFTPAGEAMYLTATAVYIDRPPAGFHTYAFTVTTVDESNMGSPVKINAALLETRR